MTEKEIMRVILEAKGLEVITRDDGYWRLQHKSKRKRFWYMLLNPYRYICDRIYEKTYENPF